MAEIFEKYAAMRDKLVLLGIFALSLGIAQLIVVSRAKVELSKPVALAGSGISVSLPVGKGWNGAPRWSRDDNTFVVAAVYVTQKNRTPVSVLWQYSLEKDKIGASKIFELNAGHSRGEIVNRGQIISGTATVEWARLTIPNTNSDLLWGILEPPGGGQLELKVFYSLSHREMADKVFRSLAESLRFQK